MNGRRKSFTRKLCGSTRYVRLLIPHENSDALKAGMVCLQPDESVGEHSTDAREEALVILCGSAQITCGNEEPFEAGAGTFVYIPAHTKHDVVNKGTELLRYIFMVTPV